jgi:hypothetical protein
MQRAKNSIKNILLVFAFGLLSQSLFSQEATEIPLSDILQQIEKQHQVRFSYAPQVIANRKLDTPPNEASLEGKLVYLEEITELQFNLIDKRYITIIPKESPVRCATLIDIQSGLTIEGATVYIDQTAVVNSDDFGLFSLPRNLESGTITISHIGYTSINIALSQLGPNCPKIMMHEHVTALNEVVLSQLFVKGITKKNDGTYAINTANFGLLPGQVDNDVLQIVQSLPGVQSINETVSNINIRGGTHDENLILWDDIKMYQSGHFFGLISAFNPEVTEQVVVHKNGTHARFGESVSGVIDMRSRDELTDSITVSAGMNLINGNAFISIPITNRFGMQISGRRSINKLFQTPVYNNFANRIFQNTQITNTTNQQGEAIIESEEDFNFYDFSAKALWTPSEKDKISLNFLTIDNALKFTETIQEFSFSTTSDLQQSSIVGGLSWDHIWNDKVHTKILGYGTYLLKATNKDVFTAQKVFQENEVIESGSKLDIDYVISNKISLEGGYQFTETGISNTQDVNLPRFRSFVKDVIRTHSVFGMFHIATNDDKTNFAGGLRVNYFGKFDRILLEPRLQIHQALGNGFSANILGEFKSQSSTQRIDFDSDFLGVEKRRWVLANNKDIPIIESKQLSIGAEYKKNNWLISAEGFYKTVSGITTSNEGFQNQFQFVSAVGDYKVTGVEMVLNKKTASFSTWISYQYLKNDYDFPTLDPASFPHNLDVRHAATIAGSYTKNRFKAALGINWRSGKPHTIPSEDQVGLQNPITPIISYETPNAQRLNNYFRTDLSVEYRWGLSEKIEAKINAAILNLFNTKNVLNRRYVLESDENNIPQINQVAEISLGLTPNFSLQILF